MQYKTVTQATAINCQSQLIYVRILRADLLGLFQAYFKGTERSIYQHIFQLLDRLGGSGQRRHCDQLIYDEASSIKQINFNWDW